ncbi:MAG: hypothetical protein JO323_08215 [Acidobacteriia bacterium]|nr:hypothetical protein [Terriglobia bacterium]
MSGRIYPGVFGPTFSLLLLLAPASGLLPAQDIPLQSTSQERNGVVETYVTERLAVWQQRLSLQSWKISVIMAHPEDLKPKTLGNIHWDSDKKSAIIRVLHAADYKLPFREMLEDMEFTVVHELIHLELSSLPRSEASRRDEEHAVNQIADALLKLDRINPGGSR